MPDLIVHNHGSIFCVEPITDAGQDWLDQNISRDHLTWGRNQIVVEHRFIDAIIDGAIGCGLEVQ